MPIALFACFGLKNFFHLEGNDILGPYLGPGFYKLAEKGYWLIVHLVSKRKKTSFRIILAADFILSFEVEKVRLLVTYCLTGWEWRRCGCRPLQPPHPRCRTRCRRDLRRRRRAWSRPPWTGFRSVVVSLLVLKTLRPLDKDNHCSTIIIVLEQDPLYCISGLWANIRCVRQGSKRQMFKKDTNNNEDICSERLRGSS